MNTSKAIFILIVVLLTASFYAQDGTLDQTFGDGGIVTYSMSDSSRIVKTIPLLDGKILVVTYKWKGNTMITRYNSDGSPDVTFGNNGVQEYSPANETIFVPHDVAVDKNGKIVIVGIVNYPITDYSTKVLLYFNSDGILDNLIGDGGIVTFVNPSAIISLREIITFTNDNKILLAHTLAHKLTITRYNQDGTIDFSFGTLGSFKSNNNYLPIVMKLDWEGNIFLLFYQHWSEGYDYQLKVLKLNKDGQVFQEFADNGILTADSCIVPWSYLLDMFITNNMEQLKFDGLLLMHSGKISIIGGSLDEDEYGFNIEQYRADGILNTGFGNDGITKVLFDENLKLEPYNCALLPHDEIAISGYGRDNDTTFVNDSFITKITKYGGIKSNFGTNGITLIKKDTVSNQFWDMLVAPEDFHILVTNFSWYGLGNTKQSFLNYINSKNNIVNHFSGEVSGYWDVDTAYIDGDIYIPENESLVIAPGTVVNFTDEYKFDVYGTLIAKGTEIHSIFFTTDSLYEISTWPYIKGFWYGITFHSTTENGQAPSSLDYCNIKNAYPTWLDEMSNRYGGGLIYYKSQIDVSNTTFTDCQNDDYSRGVFSALYSHGSINNVSFLKTIIYNAGSLVLLKSEVNIDNLNMYKAAGISIDSSIVQINNSIIDSSSTAVSATDSEIRMTNCEISNNSNMGIYAKQSELTIDSTLVKRNGDVGGLFIESPSTFTNCEIIENGSNGLRFQTNTNWGTTFTSDIRNCVIAKNNATGIKFFSRNNANITNCTIADNNSSSGWGGVVNGDVDTHLKNCIVFNNGSNLDFQADGLYTYSIIQGNYVGSDTATTNLQNVDPLFRDAVNGDYHLQSVDCGYSANSPGIDSGDPNMRDYILDCATAGLGTELTDIGAYGGDVSILPDCHFAGEVSGIWDCEDIYVDGDILIPEGDTLQISETVNRVLITGPYQIKVEGVLLAIGPDDDREETDLNGDFINFQGGAGEGEAWKGILFNNLNDSGVGTSIIENCRFDYANKMDMTYQGGGAIAIYNSDQVKIKSSVFYANSARLGGAIYIANSNPHIEDCYFELNGKESGTNGTALTTAGGAMYIKNSNPYLHRLQFLNNYSISGGAAVLVDNSSITISNILLAQNETAGLGGAIEVFSDITGSMLKIVNMTSADNVAVQNGGGTFHTNGENTELEVINSIMYGNTKPELYTEETTPVITYSIIDSASTEAYFGEGCLEDNPYLVDGAGYKLANNSCPFSDGNNVVSPAIDAGHPDSLDAELDCYAGLGTSRADMGYYGGRYSDMPVGVKDKIETQIPSKYELAQNYPNPFNPTTVINYSLPKTSDVRVVVYNMLGQEVATLINTKQVAGNYQVKFDASNLTTGVYFYSINAGNFTSVKKMILIK